MMLGYNRKKGYSFSAGTERNGLLYRFFQTLRPGQLFTTLLFFLILQPFLFATTLAVDLQVSASVSSNNVVIGERFTLDVHIQSREPRNTGRPELPELDGMRYLTTVPRTSTSYSLVNGIAQMTYRYSYSVEAVDTGAYQIPPVYIDIDGREYRTQPVTVTIREADSDLPQLPAAQPDRQAIYIELELNEERPVRGQQIIAEIVLYFRNTIDVNSFHVTRSWQTEGFWREDLNESQTRRPESVILDGLEYRRAVLARYALFPTRSGELTIPSFSIQAAVRQSGRFRDQYSTFFDGFSRQRDVNLETSPRTLQVSVPPPPPSDGQYISALGQFTVDRTLSQERVKLGEAVDVITEIKGSGNLGLISRPSFEYPGSFDTHRPREIIERDQTAPRMSGSKQFRDVLIARSAGTFTIPESTIIVYNDALRRYERTVLPELTLEVVRDPNARITLAHSDHFRLTPVRGSVTWRRDAQPPFYHMWWFWLALAVPLFLYIMSYRAYRYRNKLTGDHNFYRYEQAWHNASRRLDELTSLRNIKEVYSGIYKSVSNFITDRMNLPAAGHTEEQLVEALQQRNVEAPLANRTLQLLKKCATIRYAPDPSTEDATRDIAEARKIISELKMQL